MEPAVSVAALFAGSGLDTRAVDDIRRAVWTKLVTNACFNTLCALTGAQQRDVARDEALGATARGIMLELEGLARASGHAVDGSADAAFALAFDKGNFKPSTLQDMEAGRPLEVAALVDAPLELAQRLHVSMPLLGAVGAALRLKARCAGLLP
jgi:2-dehydropantoate 2-reductase